MLDWKIIPTTLLVLAPIAACADDDRRLTEGAAEEALEVSGPEDARVVRQYDAKGAVSAELVVRADRVELSRGGETRLFQALDTQTTEVAQSGGIRPQVYGDCDSIMDAVILHCGRRGSNIGCRVFSSLFIMKC